MRRARLLFLGCGIATAQAGLEWGPRVQVLAIDPVQISATAAFCFTNGGPSVVEIREVAVSCGCLVPKLGKRTFAPGEAGVLAVEFDLRNRTGPQRKALHVRSGDGGEAELALVCDIPVLYETHPALLTWAQGEGMEAKTVRLVNPNAVPIRLVSADSSHSGFSVELKTVREGFEYEVVVGRTSDKSNLRTVVRIATVPPPGQAESKTVRFYVHAK